MFKQVIVIRKDLNMRKGKMVAQGAHASMGAYMACEANVGMGWTQTGSTKICVGVDSKEELLEILDKAEDAGLPNWLVVDKGLTEFGGVPTMTAIAIGPAKAEEIDKITGELKLL